MMSIARNALWVLLICIPFWVAASLSLFLPFDGVVVLLDMLNLPGFVFLVYLGFYNVHNVPNVLVWYISCMSYFVFFWACLHYWQPIKRRLKPAAPNAD